MSARTDVHHILVDALRACAGAHVVPAVASEQGRATATEVADIADSMETLKKEMQERLADLCQGLDQACTLAGDTASSMHALQEENATLKTTMQEAEKAIDELMAVVDKEKKKAAENLKSFTDMKSYANELELAFNDLHGRHAKLKEYYTASDSNNQV